MYICVLCSTPTYFLKMKNLKEHVKRFHEAFDQDEKGEKHKNDNSEEEGHLIKQVKIQHINDDDWEQMSDALKALEDNTNIQEDVSPKQLRWDSWGMGDEESQDNDSEDEDDLDEESDEEEESDMESDGDDPDFKITL